MVDLARRQVCLALLLIIAGAGLAAAQDVRLVDAAKRRDIDAVRVLVKQGVHVDLRQADGSTALLWATYHDDSTMVHLLLGAGADVSAGNVYGETALSLACENGNASLANEFLQDGADATASKTTGETMLMIAARAGSVPIVKNLIAYGAPVNAVEPQQHQTALMGAAAHRHADVVAALIAAGADVNARSKFGSTALHFAVQQADLESARWIVTAGADLTARLTVRKIDTFTIGVIEPLEELTPLRLAITDCQRDSPEFDGAFSALVAHPHRLSCPALEEISVLLLDHGADPNDTDGSRIPALLHAVHAGMPRVVKALIAHGADVNARVPANARQLTEPRRGTSGRVFTPTPIGATAYFVAAWRHQPDVMQMLLAAGANPRLTASDHTTPLMAAAAVPGRPPIPASSPIDVPNMFEVMKIAMASGDDVNAVNDVGQTAMHGAAKMASKELIQFLADHGARIDVADKNGETPLSLVKPPPRGYEGGQKYQQVRELLAKLAGQRLPDTSGEQAAQK
jgi:ankyrin repeat protein